MSTITTISEQRCFGGVQGVYAHDSSATGTTMSFAVYAPPQADDGPVPVLWFLSGLTCNHENAMTKAGAQAYCAEHGLMLVLPDTSPRGADVADHEDFDLGQGAGFYVDATRTPWAPHFRMWSYLVDELPEVIGANFAANMARQGITGHSMGGHGALTIALRHPGRFRSVSAFAPIANPTRSDWGRKQFSAYLGDDEAAWRAHDAAELIGAGRFAGELLVDQGGADTFLPLLQPESLEAACRRAGVNATLRTQPGYDHSYFFVATFMPDHLRWHSERL